MNAHLVRFLILITIICSATALQAQTNYDTAPQSQTGEQVYGSYFSTDIDTIGLYNGNLSLSIPVFSLPGRELPYGLTLTYNSQKWESDLCSGSPCGRYTGGWKKGNVFGDVPSFFAQYVSWEFNPDYGYFMAKFDMNVFWIDGNGTKHRYKGTAWTGSQYILPGWDNLTLNTLDSDGSTFSTGQYMNYGSDPARINFKNGNILYFRDHSASWPAYDYVTPNGNYLTKGTPGPTYGRSFLPTQDTLGRTVTYSAGCIF
jgi:hypothetical protein